MKRIISVIVMLLMLSSCSQQINLNPYIFFERLEKADKNLVAETENIFSQDGNYVCYAKYCDTVNTAFQLYTDDDGNVKKISLACNQADKADLFIECVKSVISVYSDDETETVINSIFKEKKISNECLYYDTQWYSYSAILSEKGLFFSSESKKLSPQTEVELSLKPNDIVEY